MEIFKEAQNPTEQVMTLEYAVRNLSINTIYLAAAEVTLVWQKEQRRQKTALAWKILYAFHFTMLLFSTFYLIWSACKGWGSMCFYMVYYFCGLKISCKWEYYWIMASYQNRTIWHTEDANMCSNMQAQSYFSCYQNTFFKATHITFRLFVAKIIQKSAVVKVYLPIIKMDF